jgi:Protein of unknown function (DUF2530)
LGTGEHELFDRAGKLGFESVHDDVLRSTRTTVIDMEQPAADRHFWVQAPVPPLDVDGLAVITVGTAIFGVVTIVLAISYDWLAAHGHSTWLQISVAGFALGVIGVAYCWNRRRRRRALSE